MRSWYRRQRIKDEIVVPQAKDKRFKPSLGVEEE